MAMEGKVERELELKSSADKFFKRLASELHHAPNASPEKVHAIEVHGGDFGESHGSVQLWTYTIDGKKETFKTKVEVDDEAKAVTFVGVGGHVFDRHKSYRTSIRIVPQGDRAAAKITITTEKRDAHIPDPHDYLQFVADVAKDMDEHLVGQAN